MGCFKNYINNVICECSDKSFGQNAVEFAITSGLVKLSYNFDEDVQRVMFNYDRICDAYREHCNPKKKAA